MNVKLKKKTTTTIRKSATQRVNFAVMGDSHIGYSNSLKDTVTRNLGPKNIPYKASIGNWEDNTRALFKNYLGAVYGQMNFPGTKGKVKYVWLDRLN